MILDAQVADLKPLTEIEEGNALCCEQESMESVAPGRTVFFPDRWPAPLPLTHAIATRELGRLAEVVTRGTRAIVGVYMRMCDLVRRSGLTDEEVREALKPHFAPARISDILRVSHATESVYERYTAGFFSFKSAVQVCRLYHITPSDELRQRKIRRAADRLVTLMGGPGEVTVKDRRVTVE